jgi:hypothetical protein
VENVRGLIVVRQNDRLAFLLELKNSSDVVGQDLPFKGRNVPLDSPIELREWHGNPGGGGRGLQHGRLLVIYSV